MKREMIKKFPLSDQTVSRLEPDQKIYRIKDSNRLYLKVAVNGKKSWEYRYRNTAGKWSWLRLGSPQDLSGSAARVIVSEKLDRLARGLNPGGRLSAGDAPETCLEAAELFLEFKEARSLQPNTIKVMRNGLISHLMEELGQLKLQQVTRLECRDALVKLQEKGWLSVSHGARQNLSAMFSWCIANGFCDVNPASELKAVARRYQSEPLPHLVEAEFKVFLSEFEKSTLLNPQYRRMLEVIMRTMCRPHMLLEMRWQDIDFDKQLWSLTAEQMKMNKPYICPLTDQVIDILKVQREMPVLLEFAGLDTVWKPLRRNKRRATGELITQVSERSLSDQIRYLGWNARITPHGFRHTGTTYMSEHGKKDNVLEGQLSHTKKGVEGIYNQAKYVKKRQKMMQWYSDKIDEMKRG